MTLTWETHIANISLPYGGSGNHDLGGFGVLHMQGEQLDIEVRGSTDPAIAHTQAYFENDYAFLDRVFEWYYDQSSHSVCIVLCQHPDLTNLQITIPVLEQLLVVDRASHLSFEGLDFAYAHMPFPKQADGVTPGYATIQSGNQWHNDSWGWSNNYTLLKPAVVLAGAESCSLIGCRIAHVSGTGLAVHTWRGAPGYYIESHDNYIERCEVFDTGGHGVWIGDELADIDDWTSIGASPTKSERSANNRMIHSWVHDYGTMYRDAVGVYIAHTIGTEVSNCRISNGGWSGMSIGGFQSHSWNHQTQPSGCAPHNGRRYFSNLGLTIVRNEVHTVCTHLADGGGIYMFGSADNPAESNPSILDSNFIHDIRQYAVHAYDGQLRGLYWDMGADGWVVTRNYVRHTQYLFVFNGLTGRHETAPAPAVPGTFGNATWPVAWEATCAGSGGLGWHWPAQTWVSTDEYANRWQIPTECASNMIDCVCPNTQFNGWPCDQGYRAMPLSGNKRVTFADGVAVQTANNAGPEAILFTTWFPSSGERIYQHPPACPTDGTLDW